MKNLKSIREFFPEHYVQIEEMVSSTNVYIETSAINFLMDKVDKDVILNTRNYLKSVNKKWYTSPVALWELMLTSDDSKADKIFFLVQNLLHSSLLASPSELIIRYLEYAYPNNIINYSFLSSLQIADVWQKMAIDSNITFIYDKSSLKKKISLYREVSKKLNVILSGEETGNSNDIIVNSISYTTKVTYKCLNEDGWRLPKNELYTKFIIIYVLLVIILCVDIDGYEVKRFWEKRNLANASTTIWIQYIFENYPEIFFRGPIAEMANMACYQYSINRKDRGVILDGMHMAYAPYVDMILSDDGAFKTFRDANPFYLGRLFHMSEVQLNYYEYNHNNY